MPKENPLIKEAAAQIQLTWQKQLAAWRRGGYDYFLDKRPRHLEDGRRDGQSGRTNGEPLHDINARELQEH